MNRQEIIFALLAVLVALAWSFWDFVTDEWRALTTGKKWVFGSVVFLVIGAAFIRGVVPVVWHYGNLILSLL